jgi:hypothetical protein
MTEQVHDRVLAEILRRFPSGEEFTVDDVWRGVVKRMYTRTHVSKVLARGVSVPPPNTWDERWYDVMRVQQGRYRLLGARQADEPVEAAPSPADILAMVDIEASVDVTPGSEVPTDADGVAWAESTTPSTYTVLPSLTNGQSEVPRWSAAEEFGVLLDGVRSDLDAAEEMVTKIGALRARTVAEHGVAAGYAQAAKSLLLAATARIEGIVARDIALSE